MPRCVVADGVIMLTVEPTVCRVAALRHIPWTVILVVAEWVTVADVVCACLTVFIGAVLRTDPVAYIGVIVTQALWRILFTCAGLRSTEEASHRVVALLVAIGAIRRHRAWLIGYVAEWAFFSWADLRVFRALNPLRASLLHRYTEWATKVLALLHTVWALCPIWTPIGLKGTELIFVAMAEDLALGANRRCTVHVTDTDSV